MKRSEFSEMYEEVFQLYDFGVLLNNDRTRITDYLRRHYKELYGNRAWNSLSSDERIYFTCGHIKDKMLDYLQEIAPQKVNKVRKKVDERADSNYMQATKEIRRRNDINLRKEYNLSGLSEEEIRNQYDEFRDDFRAYNDKLPIPGYEEWKEYPLRIYDYVMTAEAESIEKIDPSTPTDEEVDHYVIKAIVRALRDEWVEIDVQGIEECMYQCKKHPLNEHENNQLEVDDSLPDSEDEQRQLIEENKKTMECRLKLENIESFIFELDDHGERIKKI